MAKQRSSTRDDFDKIKDAAHKLRCENRKLRKENSTLRKQLNRVVDVELDRQLEDEITEDSIIVPEKTTEKLHCPKCNTDNVREIPAGRYLIRACSCGYRKRSEIAKRA